MRLPPVFALALLLTVPPALAAEGGIAVPAGPLGGALADLSRQAGISIGGDQPLAGRHSPGASGPLTPEQALTRMLAGTGLGFRKVGPGAYRLEALPSPHTLPAAGRHIAEPVEPIIVTATKRGADPASLPVSVGWLTAADLARLGTSDPDAALPLLGGVGSTHLGPGRNKLAIRGLSDSAFTGQTQATVGLYLDNAKVNYNAPDPHLHLIDVDRVEVLRGPQGTLYGGGSIGGILRIVPAAPDLSEQSAQARLYGSLTRSGAPGGGVEAVLNQPLLTDRLGMRLALYAEREGGVIDTAGRHNIDRTDMQGGRALFTLIPAEDWRLELGGTYQLIDTDDSHYIQGRRGCCTRAAQLAEPHDNDFDEAHVTLTGSLPFAQLHSTTAFVRHEIDSFYDASTAVPALAGLPAQPALFHEAQLSRLWTHETRLSSENDEDAAIRWLGGLHLSQQTAQSSRRLTKAATLGSDLWRRDRDDTVKEAALFGELSWRFLPHWTLTTGGRLFHVAQEVEAKALAPAASVAETEGYAKETDYTPKLAVTWHPREGTSFYAQMTEGYRPGGLNIEEAATTSGEDYRAAHFRTDELWNYELGTKLSLWQGRLALDAAIFHARWRNIQTDQLRADGLTVTTNAGDGSNTGIEIAPRLHLGPWRLDATVILNDPELTRVAPTFAGRAEGGLPGAAHLSGSASLSWKGWVAADAQLLAALDYTHTGRTHLTFSNAIRQGPVNQVNGRMKLDWSDGWSLGLAVDNILDSDANQFAYGNPFTLSAGPQTTPLRPRTFRLSVGWQQ
ncbi:TonB-dependent receptor plug domain-containing protein [Niveispirillum sp. SYP-B3756]|uniref:TonB-dependent receptor domain-containing protein n=1 Tax=Niveispirillum sp. SYP-B3756 TaxID=2662178 RepID=UPI0012917763|nr:TonB-dependent receptor [Niveispirillum sp. SYP-B3756]MQP68091.1 TonB-dependent receptor plug domain-containing protein [Niveispirillum sp. SYP-B3756]